MDALETHRQSGRRLRELRRRATDAADNHLKFIGRYALGPLSFSLRGVGHERLEQMSRFLLASSVPQQPGELEIDVVHGQTPAGQPPRWNLPHSDVRHLERLHLASDGTLAAQYNEELQSWLVLDQPERRGLLWINDLGRLPAWDVAAPFRTLFHWYLAPTQLAIVHAGAVAAEAAASLLAGPGGAGKSTSIAIAAAQGMTVFGDDLVIVGEHGGINQVFALYDSVKLDPAAPIVRELGIPAKAGWPCANKMAYRLSELGKDRLGRNAPLGTIAHSLVMNRPDTTIAAATPGQILRALAPSTLFLLRGFEQRTMAKIGALVRTVPGVHLQLGSQVEGVARALRQIA
jgi:hypothetical protein